MTATGTRVVRGLAFTGALVTVLAFSAGPVIWMFSTALKPDPEIFAAAPHVIPETPTLAHFSGLAEQTNFFAQLLNTVIVTVATTLLTIALAVPAAYSLVRFGYPGRRVVSSLILVAYMFSPIMLIVPIFVLFQAAGLTDTRQGLVIAYTTFSLPFALWLLRAFFQAIPQDLEHAAAIDGANRPQVLVLIVLPMALPGIIATSIFTFVQAWNDYLFARVLVTSSNLKTAIVALQDLSVVGTDWGMIMAAATSLTVPALIFFALVQRHLVAGWGAGAVKG